MGLWRREEEIFRSLPKDRKANIEIVFSAYESMRGDKAYLTMPITAGKRLYDTLDRYGVKTKEELERVRPGALLEEVIIPNIEAGKLFAEKIEGRSLPLVVPGIFEAQQHRWSQEEYMILWLRLITGSVKELYLADGWEYSTGGVMEFFRAMMIHHGHFTKDQGWLPVFENGSLIPIEWGARRIAEAIKDLRKRGYNTDKLRHELGQVIGLAVYGAISNRDTTYNYGFAPFARKALLDIAESTKVKVHFFGRYLPTW